MNCTFPPMILEADTLELTPDSRGEYEPSDFIAADVRHALCSTTAPTAPAPWWEALEYDDDRRPTERCPRSEGPTGGF